MKEQLLALQHAAEQELAGSSSLEELNDVRVRYMGKKGN